MADERKSKNVSKKLPCKKDKKKPWYTMWNENAIYIYLYIDIGIEAWARFKTCLKNFWLNLFGKNNTKSRPTIGAENLFFNSAHFACFFVSSILRTLAKFSVWFSIAGYYSVDKIQRKREEKKNQTHTYNQNWTQHTFNHRKRVQVWQ